MLPLLVGIHFRRCIEILLVLVLPLLGAVVMGFFGTLCGFFSLVYFWSFSEPFCLFVGLCIFCSFFFTSDILSVFTLGLLLTPSGVVAQ